MSGFSPFARTSEKVVPITVDGQAYYFVSVGYLTANLKPTDVQTLMDKRKRLSELVFEAQHAYAQEAGIKPSQAADAFTRKDAGGGVEFAEAELMDYLTPQQKAELNALGADTTIFEDEHGKPPALFIKIATLLIKHRMAYDITILEEAKAKSRVLRVSEPLFPVSKGDRFKFGDVVVEVAEPFDPESGELVVQPLPAKLEAGSVGYQWTGKEYRKGIADWDEEKTLATCPDYLYQLLYTFYSEEAAGGKHQKAKLTLNRSLPPSESPEVSPSPQLTGENSTGESSPMDCQIPDSAEMPLVTAMSA